MTKTDAPHPPNLDETQDHLDEGARQAIEDRPGRRWRSTLFQIYLVAAGLAFAMLALLARASPYFNLDVRISQAFQALGSPWLLAVMAAASWPGYYPQAAALLAVLALAVFAAGLRWEAACLMITALGADLLNLVVKLMVDRPRPTADLVRVFQKLNDPSFPSGHVMYYTALFGFLFFLIFTLMRSSACRLLLLTITGGPVLVIGPARVYLGLHWASDVLGAYLLGSLVLLLGIRLYAWGVPRFTRRQPVDTGE